VSATLFHIIAPADWDAAVAAGVYRPPSLPAEGFIHCSWAEQVTGTANRYYHGEPELMVVELDPSRIAAELRIEDSHGTGASFPHLYGPILVDAAVALHALRRDGAGDWVFSADASDSASPDR